MKRACIVLALSTLASLGYGADCTSKNGLPDPHCTSGSLDPRVTQANVHETICNTKYSAKGSWSRTWRPPVRVTNKLKAERGAAYGVQLPLDCYEGDHDILESAGGCPGPTAPTKAPKGVKGDTWRVPAGKAWCSFEANFWDEPWGRPPHWAKHCGAELEIGAHDKDLVEDKIHNLICSDKITLAEGQQSLMSDWREAYRKYVGPLPGDGR